MPRVHRVIGATVNALGVSIGVKAVVEAEWPRLPLVGRLHQVTEFARESSRADKLEVVRTTAGDVIGATATDHIHIELRDDGVERHGRFVGVVRGTEESDFLRGVPDKQQRPLRFYWRRGKCLREFEEHHGARTVVIGAVLDGVRARRPDGAQRIHVHSQGGQPLRRRARPGRE